MGGRGARGSWTPASGAGGAPSRGAQTGVGCPALEAGPAGWGLQVGVTAPASAQGSRAGVRTSGARRRGRFRGARRAPSALREPFPGSSQRGPRGLAADARLPEPQHGRRSLPWRLTLPAALQRLQEGRRGPEGARLLSVPSGAGENCGEKKRRRARDERYRGAATATPPRKAPPSCRLGSQARRGQAESCGCRQRGWYLRDAEDSATTE